MTKVTPIILIFFSLNLDSMVNKSNILDGTANKINPSINNNNPKAVVSSLITLLI